MSVLEHVRASSITRTLNIIGDRWTIIILRDAFLGVTRFRDWQSKNNIARSILINRLNKLVEVGCFKKVLYQDRPKRYEYQLTDMGKALYPIAALIWAWEDKWFARAEDVPVRLIHKSCGHAIHPELKCDVCNEFITIHNVTYKDGPGVGLDCQVAPRHQRRSRISSKNKDDVMMIERAADIIGDRWSNLTLSAAYLGIRRFDDIQNELKIATNILSNRLVHLVESEVLSKCLYSEKPARYEYRLTEKGRALFPVMVAMMTWGDDWLCDDRGVPFILVHRECGKESHPVVKCSHCHEVLLSSEVEFLFD
ncbi:MAG: transcriptional regulator [Alphaproteobacteria bacterium]|nr:MAG: transcriptional regulator [Alphaproteobacteria bacterium]